MLFHTRFNTPLCPIIIIGNAAGLTHVHLESEDAIRPFAVDPSWKCDNRLFKDARRQIEEYFHGSRFEFTVPLNPCGTPFQKKVWSALRTIPFGSLCTYSDIAAAAGIPKGARAAGTAIGRNPLPLIVPCHRVIGKNGSLTGFAHGLKTKERLLRLEEALT